MRAHMSRTGRASTRRQRVAAFERLEDRRLLAFNALVDFQPPNVPTQSGYQKDTGAVFGGYGGPPRSGAESAADILDYRPREGVDPALWFEVTSTGAGVPGAADGPGGRGGVGGQGGAGAGGPSFAIVKGGSATVTLTDTTLSHGDAGASMGNGS